MTLKDGFFYDWLSITQLHDIDLPVVCSVISEHKIIETGELFCSRRPHQHEGSFSTVITVTCDGNRVQVSGNPSRYNRPDNLFGYTSIDDCIAVYNSILIELGLPPFNKVTKITPVWDEIKKKFWNVSNGAEIVQIHVTKNYCVGPGNEKRFLRGLSSFAYRGNLGNLYPNGNTLDWLAGSRRLYFKIYNKAWSLLKERKKLINKYTEQQLEYYDQVIEYCKSMGVVRVEYEFKSDYLRDRNLRYYGFSDITEVQKFSFIQDCFKRLGVTVTDYDSITDALIENGSCSGTQAANATQMYFLMWLHGSDLRTKLKKSAFYKHRSRLLTLGYDIAETSDISALPIRINQPKTIELTDLEIPDWYVAV